MWGARLAAPWGVRYGLVESKTGVLRFLTARSGSSKDRKVGVGTWWEVPSHTIVRKVRLRFCLCLPIFLPPRFLRSSVLLRCCGNACGASSMYLFLSEKYFRIYYIYCFAIFLLVGKQHLHILMWSCLGKCNVKLTMRENRSAEVNTNKWDWLSLAFVDSHTVCKANRKLKVGECKW